MNLQQLFRSTIINVWDPLQDCYYLLHVDKSMIPHFMFK